MPRLDLVASFTFTRDDIPRLKLRISVIAQRRRELAGKVFTPHNDNCLYCARKATCAALNEKALMVGKGYNSDQQLVLPEELHSSQITDPEQMARALNLVDVLEKWCDSVRAHALKMRMEFGTEIPGRDLVERQGRRVIDNPVKALEIAQQFGLTEEEFTSAASVSFNDLAKLLMEKAPKGEKKKVAQKFEDALKDAMALTKSGSYHVLQRTKKSAVAIDV